MECLKSHVRFITVSLPIFWPRNIYPCFKLRKMVIFICCFSKQATLRNCETQTVQCTQTQENLFAFYLNQILTILFELVPVQTSDPQTSDGTNIRLTNVGQYKHRTSTNIGPVQTSDWYKHRTSTNSV